MAPPKTPRPNGYTYASAGVDIDAGNAFVKKIGPLAKATARPGAEAALGGFGALFDLKAAGYDDPLLVSATDGVGTKLELAVDLGKHDTIGIDLVAMCVNDLIVQGGEPLFFLDYLATGKLDLGVSEDVVKGIADGCKQSGCALIGGETAEMPGLYQTGHYDLAGFAVGAVDRDKLLPRPDIAAGDVLIGLPSSGIHSNGYSLVRRLVADHEIDLNKPLSWTEGRSLGEKLLTPTKLYVRPLLPLLKAGRLKALAHITGGGLSENVPRVLPDGLGAEIDLNAWTRSGVFNWLQSTGGIAPHEMLRTFNCGIGMVLVADRSEANELVASLSDGGENAVRLGEITPLDDAPVTYLGNY